MEWSAKVLYTENFLGEDKVDNLSPILVELISNTNNHANPNSDDDSEKIPWFLSIVEDNITGKMMFSVVDLGVGIFESLKMKGLANTNKLFRDTIKDMYANSQSKFLRTSIPQGVDSSTGLFYRGQGLQTVHGLVRSKSYNVFRIITNKAVINMKNTAENTIDTADSLSGTVFYWEMSQNE